MELRLLDARARLLPRLSAFGLYSGTCRSRLLVHRFLMARILGVVYVVILGPGIFLIRLIFVVLGFWLPALRLMNLRALGSADALRATVGIETRLLRRLARHVPIEILCVELPLVLLAWCPRCRISVPDRSITSVGFISRRHDGRILSPRRIGTCWSCISVWLSYRIIHTGISGTTRSWQIMGSLWATPVVMPPAILPVMPLARPAAGPDHLPVWRSGLVPPQASRQWA